MLQFRVNGILEGKSICGNDKSLSHVHLFLLRKRELRLLFGMLGTWALICLDKSCIKWPIAAFAGIIGYYVKPTCIFPLFAAYLVYEIYPIPICIISFNLKTYIFKYTNYHAFFCAKSSHKHITFFCFLSFDIARTCARAILYTLY